LESTVGKELEKLELDEEKEIKAVKKRYALLRGELRKQCVHKYDNKDTALERAGYPWHTGWDRCLICGSYIETNEYGRGEYLKVVYEGDTGHFDGLTRFKTYIVDEETENQYVVKNDIGGKSTISKDKFKIIS
jgi:hypothetical protein